MRGSQEFIQLSGAYYRTSKLKKKRRRKENRATGRAKWTREGGSKRGIQRAPSRYRRDSLSCVEDECGAEDGVKVIPVPRLVALAIAGVASGAARGS